MKQCRLFLIAMALAVVSCHSDVAEVCVVEQSMAKDEVSIYAISEDEAIENLNEFMAAFDGAETRANPRVVKRVESVKLDNVCATRSSEELDIDNLLYIVEFEDGQGSAVLGADRRVESVFALLDTSVITAQDFEDAANGVNEDDLGVQLAGMIAKEAVSQAAIELPGITLPEDELKYSDWLEVTKSYEYKVPQLDTCWDTLGGFNQYCLDRRGRPVEASSLAVAVAQLLLYHAHGDHHITVDGDTYEVCVLELIHNDLELDDDVYDYALRVVAAYIASVSSALDIDYSRNFYEENLSTVVSLLENMGYDYADVVELINQNVDDCFDTIVRDMLWIGNKPFVMQGEDTETSGIWNWVVDGYLRRVVNRYWVHYWQSGEEISRELKYVVTDRKVHVNFGQFGDFNGYYSFGIFDISEMREGEDYLPEYGDVQCELPENYSNNLKLVVYDL